MNRLHCSICEKICSIDGTRDEFIDMPHITINSFTQISTYLIDLTNTNKALCESCSIFMKQATQNFAQEIIKYLSLTK